MGGPLGGRVVQSHVGNGCKTVAAPTRRPAGLERAGKRKFSFRLLCCAVGTAGAARVVKCSAKAEREASFGREVRFACEERQVCTNSFPKPFLFACSSTCSAGAPSRREVASLLAGRSRRDKRVSGAKNFPQKNGFLQTFSLYPKVLLGGGECRGEAGIFFQEKPASPLHILLPKSSFRGGGRV